VVADVTVCMVLENLIRKSLIVEYPEIMNAGYRSLYAFASHT